MDIWIIKVLTNIKSYHTQACTCTLPSASLRPPRPGTHGEPSRLHSVPTLSPLPTPEQQRGPVPADAEVMEPLVSGAKDMNTQSVVLWGHLCFRLLAFPLYPSVSLNRMSVWWHGLPLPALVCSQFSVSSQWGYSLPSALLLAVENFAFSTLLKAISNAVIKKIVQK